MFSVYFQIKANVPPVESLSPACLSPVIDIILWIPQSGNEPEEKKWVIS